MWCGREWTSLETVLAEDCVPYKVITYRPQKPRFELSTVMRVINVDMKDGYVQVLISPEQAPNFN